MNALILAIALTGQFGPGLNPQGPAGSILGEQLPQGSLAGPALNPIAAVGSNDPGRRYGIPRGPYRDNAGNAMVPVIDPVRPWLIVGWKRADGLGTPGMAKIKARARKLTLRVNRNSHRPLPAALAWVLVVL
jgi:hypothetical protein